MKKILNYVIYPTCTLFTVYVFLFLAVGTLASSNAAFIAALTFNSVFMLLLLSFTFSLLNCIFLITKLNMVLKITLHFTGLLLSHGMIFWAFGRRLEGFSASMLLLALLVISVVYFVILFLRLLIKSAMNKKASESESYSPVYKK